MQHDSLSAERYFRTATLYLAATRPKMATIMWRRCKTWRMLLRHGRYAEARLHLDDTLAVVTKSEGTAPSKPQVSSPKWRLA